MMVCPWDDSRLLLVLQIDHSRVAGLFAAHWGNATFAPPQPFTSVALAAHEHDSGWGDWEMRPTLNAEGYPRDYIGGAGAADPFGRTWLDFYRDGVSRVVAQDPYAGLLVLMHSVGLITQGYGLLPYMADRRGDPVVDAYLDDREALRRQLLDTLEQSAELRPFASQEQVWTNYKLMQAFDQLAQFVCNRYPFSSTARRNGPSRTLSDVPIPVGPGKEDVRLAVDVQDERRAILRPYPFDVDPLEVTFPGRLVPRRQYASQEEFLRDYYRAERVIVTYTLHAA